MKPIDGWHRFPWQRSLTVFQNEPRARPSLIVGVEVDVGDRGDWKKWWPRPLGIAQWTIAGTAGHPVLIDAMRRVSEAVNPFPQPGVHEAQEGIAEQSHRNLDAVVEKTGPGPFTDAVLRCKFISLLGFWLAERTLTCARTREQTSAQRTT